MKREVPDISILKSRGVWTPITVSAIVWLDSQRIQEDHYKWKEVRVEVARSPSRKTTGLVTERAPDKAEAIELNYRQRQTRSGTRLDPNLAWKRNLASQNIEKRPCPLDESWPDIGHDCGVTPKRKKEGRTGSRTQVTRKFWVIKILCATVTPFNLIWEYFQQNCICLIYVHTAKLPHNLGI